MFIYLFNQLIYNFLINFMEVEGCVFWCFLFQFNGFKFNFCGVSKCNKRVNIMVLGVGFGRKFV